MIEYVLNFYDIQEHNIVFKHPIKNQNQNYINYYKLLYSNEIINLKYILIDLKLTEYDLQIENNNYNISIHNNNKLYDKLHNIESLILNTLNKSINKKITLSIKTDLMSRDVFYKFTKFPNIKQLYLKISGVWENTTNIGLVYKIYYNMSTEKLSSINC